ncbi:DinB family protein [Fulvitalea axinellae]
MKKFLAFFFTLSFLSQANAQEGHSFADEFTPVWQRAKAYTLELAELMPEEKYGYKPTEDIMSFREHLQHLIKNFAALQTYVTGNKQCELSDKTANLDQLDKKQLIALTGQAFDFIDKLANNTSDAEAQAPLAKPFFAKGVDMNKRKIFYLLRDHTTHHRGQLVIYLRMNGIKPPRYRGW